jgi:hypothetical protein
MRRRRSVAAAGALLGLAFGLAGCGSSSGQREERRALAYFFANTPHGQTFGKRFPHRPGSVGCTVFDHQLRQRVKATCATDVAVGPKRVVVTFTESWSHGSRTRTWFVFLHPDGRIQGITREGVAPSG